MEFYAHTLQDKNGNTLPESEWQTLSEHLQNTAELAQSFALPSLKNSAFLLGLFHDIGKCQPTFQKRLRGGKAKIDHAVCGAKEVMQIFIPNLGQIFAYPLIGHHSGLPDRGAKGEDNSDETALFARLRKECGDYSAYKTLVTTPNFSAVKTEISAWFHRPPTTKVTNQRREANQKTEFLIRYLYSCLTDADFLDTERFVLGKPRESFDADFSLCEEQLKKKFSSFQTKTPLQKARNSLREQALENLAKTNKHIYLLDMPTGSGKTLCSVQLALEKLRNSEPKKKRIIYVIPYTSIIEQTANELHKIFPQLTILQHHSNFDFDSKEELETEGEISATEKLKKSTENWDAPLIITTNVQFFESIYSNRSSKLRKFHNMSNSIIVFDEIHTLPIKNFVPCIRAVKSLAENFDSEIFFLTATMPNFPALCENFAKTGIEMCDLLPDKSEYSLFDKCSFEFVEKVDVIEKLNKNKSTLVVSNSKKGALKLFELYDGKKFYLSTYMTPVHRLAVIGEIRSALERGEKFVVFSTSLIEAGVDLDFDEVWRELAGVDNILQTAGRCNREGLRKKEESKVFIFQPEVRPNPELQHKAEITAKLIEEFGVENLGGQACVMSYFERIYRTQKNEIQIEKFQNPFDVDFKTIAQNFEMIDSNTFAIVVPLENSDVQPEIEKLKANKLVNHRKLQKASISVTKSEVEKLLNCGIVNSYDGVFVLEDQTYYSPETGLDIGKIFGEDYIY